MERKAVSILRDWAIPTATFLVLATGAWVKIQEMASKHDREIQELRQELRAGRTAASNGILDATAHGAMDHQIRHYLEEELGKDGYRRFVNQFADHTVSKR